LPEDPEFTREFTALFEVEFPRLFRYLDRLGGDPDSAADLAQEAFVRLYRRGAFPESTEAWLVTVATNLFRNSRNSGSRRRRLLTPARGEGSQADPAPDPTERVDAEEARREVRAALDRLSERERQLLLLRAEGFSYAELAGILGISEGSVGTLLARAREAFKRELAHAT
jgi:RNA polymerase sigma-70 factor (ECF subfamily)